MGRKGDREWPGLFVNKVVHGGVVTSAETAIAIASAVLKGHEGEEGLKGQGELHAYDDGDVWRVVGNRVSMEGNDQPSVRQEPWSIELHKDDGRVLHVGYKVYLEPPKHVQKIIDRVLEERARGNVTGGGGG